MTKNPNRCNSRFNGSYRSYISISSCLIIRNKFNRHLNVAFISRVKLLLVQIYYCPRKESNYRGNRFCIDYLCFCGDFLSISIQKSVKVFSTNAGKYRPEKTLHLNTFYATKKPLNSN